MSFSATLNFWIESVCLSSEFKDFHIVEDAKESERCPNVLVPSLGIHKFQLSEETESLYSMQALIGS